MTRKAITSYTASAGDTRNGVKTLKVATTTSFSVAGIVGPQTIEGNGKGTSTIFLGPDGRYMGGTTDEELVLSVSIPQAPEPIPVTAKSRSHIAAQAPLLAAQPSRSWRPLRVGHGSGTAAPCCGGARRPRQHRRAGARR